MIETPALLTIQKPNKRPTAEQIAALSDVPTSFVVDAMNGSGALATQISPLSPNLPSTVTGPALTVQSSPGDCLATLAAPKFVSPGDIAVITTGAFQDRAALGDRVAGAFRNGGAKGIVADAPARDLPGIIDVGLPVWATGLTPNSPSNVGQGSIGLPIQIGGRRVETGDMIIADRDGVVTVPFDEIDAVIERLKTVSRLEEERDALVADGLIVTEDIEALLVSDQVAWID